MVGISGLRFEPFSPPMCHLCVIQAHDHNFLSCPPSSCLTHSKHVGLEHMSCRYMSPNSRHNMTFKYQCDSLHDTIWRSKMFQCRAFVVQNCCILTCCYPYFSNQSLFFFVCVFFSHHASFNLKYKPQVSAWHHFESSVRCLFLGGHFQQFSLYFCIKSYIHRANSPAVLVNPTTQFLSRYYISMSFMCAVSFMYYLVKLCNLLREHNTGKF